MYLIELYWACVTMLVLMAGTYRWPDLRHGRPRMSHYVGLGVMAGLTLVTITVPAYRLLSP